MYDDEVRKWVSTTGVENLGKRLVNSRDGPVTFDKPRMTLQTLMNYGFMLVQEQENVKRVQLADKYLSSAALGDANEDAIKQGTYLGKYHFLQIVIKHCAPYFFMGSTSNYLGVIFSACLLILGTSIQSTVKRMEKEKS